jgi:uncharacterized PurR-regulated membrane protein YhhQ (DUF165 family)
MSIHLTIPGHLLWALRLPITAMVVVVVVSNISVQYPINDWITWGALTYPVAFLVTDLTNHRFGAGATRRVVYIGFTIAVILSVWAAGPRIAFASGSAFLVAQLLDVMIFDRLRQSAMWWRAPLVSSLTASAVDTALFFSIAFAGTGLPWLTWGLGDFGVKVTMAIALLIPFRVLMRFVLASAPVSGQTTA